jgi:hypothetical protein
VEVIEDLCTEGGYMLYDHYLDGKTVPYTID